MTRATLTTAEVARRWNCTPVTIRRRYRDGMFPPPIDPTHPTRSWRWSLGMLEAYEHGETT